MISKIEIKNFRSIKNILLLPKDLCALIGPNSSGKSNILKALDLILGEGWTTKAKIAKELFNNINEKIFIMVELGEPVEWKNLNNIKRIKFITLEMSYQPLECSVKLWEGQPNENEKGYYINEEFKKSCCFIYIPAERSLEDELRVSQWTMLGKMMKSVYENYIANYDNDEQKLKDDFKTKMQEAKDFLEKDFSDSSVTFKKFVTKFKEHCRENSSGLANDFEPILDIYNLNWFYKTLQIHVKEAYPEKDFDSKDVGAGMQNLLLISIFQTYADLMGSNVIFGIEEPEIYLYPQAQRYLYKNLQKISKKSQIFYTTHNPNFVDAARADDIFLLRKNENSGSYLLKKDEFFNTTSASEDKIKYKIYTQFNTERNEIFFAKKVIIVEGESDKILISTICEEKWGINLDKQGISIISTGGKAGVVYFLRVCKLIGLENYFAIWDTDEELEQDTFLREIENSRRGVGITPDLENFLKIPAEEKKKMENAHKWALEIDTDSIPEELNKIKDFLNK